MSEFGTVGYGVRPNENISQHVTPKDHCTK